MGCERRMEGMVGEGKETGWGGEGVWGMEGTGWAGHVTLIPKACAGYGKAFGGQPRSFGTSCDACPSGTYAVAGAGRGMEVVAGGVVCQMCPSGTYSQEGFERCAPYSAERSGDSGSSECATCRAGTYAAVGSSSCQQFLPGRWSQGGLASCSDCLPGTYSTIFGADSSSSCADCRLPVRHVEQRERHVIFRCLPCLRCARFSNTSSQCIGLFPLEKIQFTFGVQTSRRDV